MHTQKHRIWWERTRLYDLSVFWSGGRIYTFRLRCLRNGRTEQHSFRSRYGARAQAMACAMRKLKEIQEREDELENSR
jgi:hypothetical protein